MKIALDLQCCQGDGKLRGIGRYVLDLTRAMIQNAPDDEFWIVLSGSFVESEMEIRRNLDDVLPSNRFVSFAVPDSVHGASPLGVNRRHCAELMREHFIASLEPDVVFVGSVCEGMGQNIVTSIGLLVENRPTATILFDLIPFIRPHEYTRSVLDFEWYEEKIAHLKRADLLLAISESSRSEAIEYLDVDPLRVVNISGGCSSNFFPDPAASEEVLTKLKTLGIEKRYFLSAATFEPRKNIDAFIEACSLLPSNIVGDYQFVLICDPRPDALAHLMHVAENFGIQPGQFIVTGRVSDPLLRSLYSSCYAFVYTSLHEGFGLPVLEAMRCGAATIASNITSLAEILQNAETMFDPTRPAEIAQMMTRLALDQSLLESLRARALSRANEFSWNKTAQKALLAMRQLVANSRPNKQEAVSRYFGPTRYERLINACAGVLASGSDADRLAVANSIASNIADPRRLADKGKHRFPKSPALPPISKELPADPLTSSICQEADFSKPDFHRWMSILKEAPRYHRKLWEFFFIAQALEEQGLLSHRRSGVGFGVGTEPLPAAFAARGVEVLASDQGIEEATRAGWASSDQHSKTVIELNNRCICDPDQFAANVRFREIDMNNIPKDLHGQFDFTWSACCLEHLGSIRRGLNFIVNSTRLVRAGGVCVHTTEINLSSNNETIETRDLVLFRKRDIEQVVARLESVGCAVFQIDWSNGNGWLDDYVDLPPYLQAPHLRLRLGDFNSTSIGLIIKRLN